MTRLRRSRDTGLDHLSVSVIGAADAMELSLRPMHPKPEVTLSIRDIHYFAMQRLPHDEIDFCDFEATTLTPGLVGAENSATPVTWHSASRLDRSP